MNDKFYMFKTWLGLVNFFIFQWFFVRLRKTSDMDGSNVEWSFIKGIVPLTGWWTKFKKII